jgi:hypothetical protein
MNVDAQLAHTALPSRGRHGGGFLCTLRHAEVPLPGLQHKPSSRDFSASYSVVAAGTRSTRRGSQHLPVPSRNCPGSCGHNGPITMAPFDFRENHWFARTAGGQTHLNKRTSCSSITACRSISCRLQWH